MSQICPSWSSFYSLNPPGFLSHQGLHTCCSLLLEYPYPFFQTNKLLLGLSVWLKCILQTLFAVFEVYWFFSMIHFLNNLSVSPFRQSSYLLIPLNSELCFSCHQIFSAWHISTYFWVGAIKKYEKNLLCAFSKSYQIIA